MAHDDGPKGRNTMSDEEKKKETNITPQPDAENKKESGELSEEELKKATGGGTTTQTKSWGVTVGSLGTL
jgi:hypothetical protein